MPGNLKILHCLAGGLNQEKMLGLILTWILTGQLLIPQLSLLFKTFKLHSLAFVIAFFSTY